MESQLCEMVVTFVRRLPSASILTRELKDLLQIGDCQLLVRAIKRIFEDFVKIPNQ